MSVNLVKAVLIINAWSIKARLAAAAKRKKKGIETTDRVTKVQSVTRGVVNPTGKPEYTKSGVPNRATEKHLAKRTFDKKTAQGRKERKELADYLNAKTGWGGRKQREMYLTKD